MEALAVREYPYVLNCSTCGTDFIYMNHLPEVGELMLAEDMIYATGTKPLPGERPRTCFHCGKVVLMSVKNMEARL